jgi:peptide/nickel transport system permease protein
MIAGLLVRRSARLVLVLLIVTSLSYLLLDLLPGDPALSLLGQGATPEGVARLRVAMHLDQPWPVRYGDWLLGLLHGDFGRSYLTQERVGQVLAERLPVTIELIVLSQVLALAIAVPLGILSARRPDGIWDRITAAGTFLMLATPPFVLAVVGTLVLAVRLHLVPATGYVGLSADPPGNLRAMILPAVTLSVGSLAVYARVLRSEMISTLQEDFIAVARAKGLPASHILLRHAFRPSAFTLLTVVGITVGGLIGGTVVVETLFSVPGVGGYVLGAIQQRDYVAAQGGLVVIVAGYVVVNFVVDVLYTIIDPRARAARPTAS